MRTQALPRPRDLRPRATWLGHLAAWPERLRHWMDDTFGSLPAKENPLFGRGPTEPAAAPSAYHIPVMAEEVMHFLEARPNKLYLDGTLGGGGHTELILKAGASVLALDQDPDALDYARERLSEYEDRVALIHMNFRNYPDLLREVGLERELDGILLDLGVSSWQLDTPERGFSFMNDGPLDMRMSKETGETAADWVNTRSEQELKFIFKEYGEEPQAGRIASAIVRRRELTPFATTHQLATLVEEVCGRRGPRHPATRVFQALRIAVNDEMGALRQALEQVHHWLKPGGRLVVITFHSGEDRIVKHFLQDQSKPNIDRPEWPAARPNPDCHYKLVLRKALAASAEETARNPRARSAKLRVAERLPNNEQVIQHAS